MKFLTLLLFIAASQIGNAQTNIRYNKELADSLGADEYGMKMYVLAILKTGINTTAKKIG